MKKKILATVLSISMLAINQFSSIAAPIGPGYENCQEQTSGVITTYLKDVYKKTTNPVYDEIVYKAFDKFESNKESANPIVIYKGTDEECSALELYITENYGYTTDMLVYRYQVYDRGQNYSQLEFTNSLNADQKINDYLNEVKNAKTLADSLKKDSDEETFKNIVSWVHNNFEYNHEATTLPPELELNAYYGGYSGKKVICAGYAMAVYQLCAMNGIEGYLYSGYVPGGVHKICSAVINGNEIFADPTNTSVLYNAMPEDFTAICKH